MPAGLVLSAIVLLLAAAASLMGLAALRGGRHDGPVHARRGRHRGVLLVAQR